MKPPDTDRTAISSADFSNVGGGSTQAGHHLRGEVLLVSQREIKGFVVDPADLTKRFVVELRLDDFPVSTARAELHDPALSEEGVGDGCYGFAFALPAQRGDVDSATVVVANTETPIGEAISLSAPRARSIEPSARSEVQWVGGLRLRGWIEPKSSDRRSVLSAFIDGECVAQADAHRWSSRGEYPIVGPAHGFDLVLPTRLADGRLRRVHVRDESGRELSGSPCEFVAFEDGLAAMLERLAPLEAETLRGTLYDRLIPQAMPFEEFEAWRGRFPSPPLESQTNARVAVALIGDKAIDQSVASLETQERCEWFAASLSDAGDGTAFEPEQLTRFLAEEANAFEFIVFARSGTVLDPRALNLLASALSAAPDAPIAYSDLVLRSEDGSTWPLAFSAFDYERTLEQGYGASFFAARSAYVSSALDGGARDLYRLFNFALDRNRDDVHSSKSTPASGLPIHVPGFLATVAIPDARAHAIHLARATRAHCESVGVRASVKVARGAAFPAVHVRRAESRGSLSIVVPAHGDQARIAAIIASIRDAVETHEFEILVVGGSNVAPLGKPSDSKVRTMRIDRPVTTERCANAVMTAASGEFLLFLDAALSGLSPEGLDEMLGRIREPDVGAVAPVIVDSDDIVQSAGYVLGMNFASAARFAGWSTDAPAYGDLLAVAHEASAIGAAGMLTRRELFRELDGFDLMRFRRRFADVDYCLRLKARGHRIVVAPKVKMLNSASKTYSVDANVLDVSRPDRDLANLRSRWGDVLVNDPFYSPLLSLDAASFSALAWPPRSYQPRSSAIGAPRAPPPGF